MKTTSEIDAIARRFELILAKELPRFYTVVRRYQFLSHTYVAIVIAASSYEINRVKDQNPQRVCLTYDPEEGVLESNQRVIYREIDVNHPKEKYLAMVGVPVPYRKNKAGREFEALERFCRAYKKTLVDNLSTIRYKDVVDYDTLLGQPS